MKILKYEDSGKKVKIKVGKGHFHEGVILGYDKEFAEIEVYTILVGIQKTTIPITRGPNPKTGFISIFHAKKKDIIFL